MKLKTLLLATSRSVFFSSFFFWSINRDRFMNLMFTPILVYISSIESCCSAWDVFLIQINRSPSACLPGLHKSVNNPFMCIRRAKEGKHLRDIGQSSWRPEFGHPWSTLMVAMPTLGGLVDLRLAPYRMHIMATSLFVISVWVCSRSQMNSIRNWKNENNILMDASLWVSTMAMIG